MTYVNLRTATAAIALGAAIWCVPAHAGVLAGTLIENTASATFEGSSGTVTVDSNTVSVKVDELLDVAVVSSDSGSVATSRGNAVLTFEITNTGNGPEAFLLTALAAVSGNDFDTTIDNIALDTNGNGSYDPGVDEILTGSVATPELAADGKVTVFVLVTVPAEANDADTSKVELRAKAVTGTGSPGTVFAGQGAGGSDAVVGATQADAAATGSLLVGVTEVTLTKSAMVRDPFGGTGIVPGATITYTILARVSGSGSVADLIVRDAAPADTSYIAGTLAVDGTPLTDASGDDTGEASGGAVSVDLGTVSGGSEHSVTFDVIID